MTLSTQLHPAPLWDFFSQICAIPHPSKHEQQLCQWIIDWAKNKALLVTQDDIGNLIISKPATPGMENRKGVILQAHLDMVPQANNDSKHNFLTDPITTTIEGDWLTAQGTTLGADNGVGVASILAILDSDKLSHGPIEALLTINEEAGMEGALGLQSDALQGELLINTDTEQEGEIYMGCAGGGDTLITFPAYPRERVSHTIIEITIKGLNGGHSGCDINTGRANANKLLARLLFQLQSSHPCLRLASLNGGSLRNAIPRESSAQLTLEDLDFNTIEAIIAQCQQQFKAELGDAEANLIIEVQPLNEVMPVFSAEHSLRLIDALNACPNGVINMSLTIESVVETSLNLGVINTLEDGSVTLHFLVRSLQDSCRSNIEQVLTSLFRQFGAKISCSKGYPGWKPNMQSELMHLISNTYESLYQRKPKIMVIHAGLECGLFQETYPKWDMVSIGPTIHYPHSPDERIDIPSVARYWKLLTTSLTNVPMKN